MSTDGSDGDSAGDTNFDALWSPDGVTRSFAQSATGLPADLPFLFSAGQPFGPYLVICPLGKGGMGQVYEAEETDSGRRVAIKILGRGIGEDEERARFLQEGRLAASLSHPNCVYVFGTSEVQGFPVIAMELAPAGTLKDLLPGDGPMPVARAVDAILQVVAGLEAAAAIGILHRDIKPSNCFVDRDGRVMVGDFGLSIAAGGRDDEAGSGSRSILGTPGFASPEQLGGEPLDLRSDIYSVGATLYYLLTNRVPFDDTRVTALLARIATEPPAALTAVRPDVPARLSAVVSRCLAPKAADRYASYAALAAALEPFRSASVTPAPLGRRFVAGVIDMYVASLPVIPVTLTMGTRLLRADHQVEAMLLVIPTVIVSIIYYGLAEGRFGCGVGKALLGLRVVDAAQLAPGIRRASLRAAVFMAVTQVLTQGASVLVVRAVAIAAPSAAQADSLAGLASALLSVVCLGLLFTTARRANGFGAWHDLASGTRVVRRLRAIESREVARAERAAPQGTSSDRRLGPYSVAADLVVRADAGVATVVTGYDDRLHRSVWLELLPPGTEPLTARRRDLGRSARARWLSGRRDADECWDAYEAIDGRPLLQVIATPQPWSRVRHWLADLAAECSAGLGDGSLPALAADRVWIGADDRARLLDWPAPGLQASPSGGEAADLKTAQRFLYGIAAGALRGVHPDTARNDPPSTPLPLSARAVVLSLRDGSVPTSAALETMVSATLRSPATVPRQRRLLQLAACAVVPVVMAIAVFVTVQLQDRSRTSDPAAYALTTSLDRLVSIGRKDPAKLTAAEIAQRDALETYVAERVRGRAEEATALAVAFPATSRLQRQAIAAKRALAKPRVSSPDELARADTAVAALLADKTTGLAAVNTPVVMWATIAMIAGGGAAVVAVAGLLGALVLGSGFTLRAAGTALVIADGRKASRLRALWRASVAWSVLVPWMFLNKYMPQIQDSTVLSAALYSLVPVALAAGAAWAWRHPSRGVQDRLAGTWLVPR